MTNEPGYDSAAAPRPPQSGAALAVTLLLAVWIGGLAFVFYPSVWFAEQIALALGRPFGRGVWIAVVVGHALAALLPSLLAQARTTDPRYRAIFRLWIIAALFALIALPVRLAAPNQAQTAALLQIVCALAFLVVVAFLRRRAKTHPAPAGGPLWPAFLAAALIGWPWVAWGALGSWLDTALNLAAALLFGLAAAHALAYTLLPYLAETADGPPVPFPVAGLVAGVALLTMGAAFGFNGQQLIFLFLLSGLGWLVAALAVWRRGERPASGWLAVALLVGLVVAAPQLFVDPDELVLILNLGGRDVGYYALAATVIGLGTALALGFLGWLLAQRADGRGRALPVALTISAWIALVWLYFGVGQPGWHGERLYVILSDQADLSGAAEIADPVERRAFVYRTLVDYADTTQAGLRGTLEGAGIDVTPYYLVNALEVDAGPFAGRWLAAQPGVDRVLDSPELRPLPEPPPVARGGAEPPAEPQWNLTAIGAPQVWGAFGALGQGIVIGQSDSGVDGNHPELRDQYRGNRPEGPAGDDYNWLDPWYGAPSPTDRGGHGTHTLGSALGRTVGVAPNAAWIGCVNLARNLGNPPRYLDCLQFLLAPFPQTGDALRDGRPDLGAHVLNNSWGCPELEGCDPTSLLPAVRALRAAGVFVVVSAGNEGSACGSISAPLSLYDEVFTVGASDESGTVAAFSSRGPVTADGSERPKPDVVAPGVDVLSAFPDGTYAVNEGTSMAGPHVAGVVALLWSADPTLIGDIERTEQLLIETAQPLTGQETVPSPCAQTGQPNNAAGWGLVDAFAAVEMALEGSSE